MRFIVLLLIAACAHPEWKRTPHDRWYQSEPAPVLHAPFERTELSETVQTLRYSAVRPLAELVSPGAWLHRGGARPRALDVNAFGQVPDSSWFTNRVGKTRWTPAMVARGPNTIEGPAPGPLLVLGGKVEGVSPGFLVQDEAGHRFLVKLDHPAYPQLSSGAELVATKLLHAAGYNVPENYAVTLKLERLVLADNATTSGRYGGTVPLTPKGLEAILSNANPFPDGTVRALFSRIIEGQALGPFEFEGVDDRDPNDRIPHEHRRSLRGLRVFSAWINNTDTRAANTLDVFQPSADPELGYVRHYLIDFGDALGAAGTEPKYIAEGYEHLVDLERMAFGFFSLGIYYPYWLPVQRSPFRAVGTFEDDVFEPSGWRPALPNPAFEASDPLDQYWAAAILARFDPDMVAAAVDAVGYRNPDARDWILRVLLARQYKLVAHAFKEVLALEDLQIDANTIRWTDLEVELGLVADDAVSYRCTVEGRGRDHVSSPRPRPECDVAPVIERLGRRGGFATIRFERASGPQRPPLLLHLKGLHGRAIPVAVERRVK